MHQSEQIESYLKNELSPSDKSIFEEMLRRDPLLKNEVGFQEAIIEGIHDFRKGQLKARLNNINVDALPSYSNAKVAAVVAGIFTLGAGSWFVADQIVRNTHTSSQTANNLRPITDSVEVEKVLMPKIQEKKIDESAENKNLTEARRQKSKIVEAERQNIKNDNFKTLLTEPDSVEKQEDLQAHDRIKFPTGDIAPVATKDNLGVKVSINNSTAYKFHYSFADSKLFLYGDFSQLYEILDFNTKEGKQLFLYYQSNFHRINENQTNIAPLLKVNDPLLIKKLKEAREQAQK